MFLPFMIDLYITSFKAFTALLNHCLKHRWVTVGQPGGPGIPILLTTHGCIKYKLQGQQRSGLPNHDLKYVDMSPLTVDLR